MRKFQVNQKVKVAKIVSGSVDEGDEEYQQLLSSIGKVGIIDSIINEGKEDELYSLTALTDDAAVIEYYFYEEEELEAVAE